MLTTSDSEVDDPELSEHLDRMLRREFDDNGPGAVIGVYRNGALIASAAVGVAGLDDAERLTASTPVDVASVSKQIGAAAILILAREGVLDIDLDVRAYVPELTVAGVTVRHCLQHTSGLPDYVTLSEVIGVPLGSLCGYDDFLAHITRSTELEFAPGTDVSYSNTGYVLAAMAAERASGTPWPEIVSSRVFHPLGMTDSLVRAYVGQPPGLARSYSVGEGSRYTIDEMDEHWPPAGARHAVGDGQVVTTIQDFADWQGFLLDGRGLGEDIREQLIRPAALTDGRSTRYGFGIRREDTGQLTAFGHSGSMWGFRTHSLTVPASGVGVAVFGNRSDVRPGELAWRAYYLATGDRRLYGAWYSAEAARLLHLTPSADNGLVATDEWETAVLWRESESSWSNDREFGWLRWDGDGIAVTDRLGRRVRYSRLPPASVPRHEATGVYRNDDFGARFTVRDGEGALEMLLGAETTLPLRFLTTDGETDVYAHDDSVIRIGRTAAGDRTLTITTGAATVRAVTRTGGG